MQVTPSIFKAYDIRGIVPSTLDEQVAEALGRAFGTAALGEGEKTVAVGRDGRISGPALSSALIRGLVAAGVEVIDVGLVTTPMLYFAAHTLCRSGIQVTGSHNPKDYNGFKMVLAGRAIYGEEIQGRREIMEAEAWQVVTDSGPREAGERGGPICRDYFIAQSATAELLWVYRERPTAADVPPARNGASDRGQRQGQGQGSTSTAGAHAPARWFLHGLYA